MCYGMVRSWGMVRWAPAPVHGVPQLGLCVVDVLGVVWRRPGAALGFVLVVVRVAVWVRQQAGKSS